MKQISIRCNRIEHWVHLRCRIWTQNSQRHNTTPPFQTLVQAPYPLPTYTTHTIATQTQTHVQHSPCSYRVVNVKPKPNPLILSSSHSLSLSSSHPLILSPSHPLILSPPLHPRRPEPYTYTFHILHQLSHPTHHAHPYHVNCAKHNT